jgi:RNA polymerase sigma factor (sigma-70 family)
MFVKTTPANEKSMTNPVISKSFQPWKRFSDEDIIQDLNSCIMSHYHNETSNLPNGVYTQEMATNDAYIGIRQAKLRDMKAPTIASGDGKNSYKTCPHCGYKVKMQEKINKKVKTVFLENDKEIVKMMNDEEADKECSESNNIMVRRIFEIKCTECDHKWEVILSKVQFSTLAFSYIRGAIQQGIRSVRQNKNNISIYHGEEDGSSISQSLQSEKSESVEDPEIKKLIHSTLNTNKFNENQKKVVCYLYGIEYKGKVIGPMHQKEVAKQIGVSKQRIHAIIDVVKDKIKESLRNSPLIKSMFDM